MSAYRATITEIGTFGVNFVVEGAGMIVLCDTLTLTVGAGTVTISKNFCYCIL